MKLQLFKSTQNANIIQLRQQMVSSRTTLKIISCAHSVMALALVLETTIKGTVSIIQFRTSTSLMSLIEVEAIVPVVWRIGMLEMIYKWAETMPNKAEQHKIIIHHVCNQDNLNEKAHT